MAYIKLVEGVEVGGRGEGGEGHWRGGRDGRGEGEEERRGGGEEESEERRERKGGVSVKGG